MEMSNNQIVPKQLTSRQMEVMLQGPDTLTSLYGAALFAAPEYKPYMWAELTEDGAVKQIHYGSEKPVYPGVHGEWVPFYRL